MSIMYTCQQLKFCLWVLQVIYREEGSPFSNLVYDGARKKDASCRESLFSDFLVQEVVREVSI